MGLALRLGKTKGELLRSISSHELTEWAAYFEVMAAEDEVRR